MRDKEPLFQIFGDHPHHRGCVVILLVGLEAIVIALPVRELHINQRIAVPYQHEVEDQPPRAPVAVDKGG